MKIIELCGKPGVGKSTIVDEIKKEYNYKNILYREDILKKNFLAKVSEKIYFYIMNYLHIHGDVEKIKNTLSDYKDVDVKYIYRMYSLYKAIKKYEKMDLLIILEEGPLQYISSLSHLNLIREESKILKLIELFSDMDIVFVYCECSIDICAQRIHKRKKKGDRFWDENIENVVSNIEKKEQNIKTLLNVFSQKKYVLDMESDILENVCKMKEIVREEWEYYIEKH